MRGVAILFMAAVAVMAAPAEEDALQEFIRGNHRFTAAAYKELIKTNKGNIIMSPFSAETVLALTAEGARGETAQEMAAGLSLPSSKEQTQKAFKTLLPQLSTSSDNVKLLSANKIYAGQDVKLEEDFRTVAQTVYKSGVQNVDFSKNVEAATKINRWVEDQTNNKISELIDSDSISSDTKLVLVNALYFSGEWQNQFEEYVTRKKDFYRTKNDPVKVDMMSQTDYFKYYENPTLNAKFLEMPYRDSDVSMVIVLPNERDGLAALEQNLEAVLATQPLRTERVDVQIPRFVIETEIKFIPILRKLGINKLFGTGADLSGLSSTDKNLYVSEVVQKAFINVTESGTEAAAATAVHGVALSAAIFPSGPIPTFHANHPFTYYIKDKTHGLVFFAGKFNHH